MLSQLRTKHLLSHKFENFINSRVSAVENEIGNYNDCHADAASPDTYNLY